MKTCTRCKTAKAAEEFHRDRCNPDGRCSWCKVCNSEFARSPARKKYLAEYRKTPKYQERKKRYEEARPPRKDENYFRHLLHKLGLTRVEYERMLDASGMRCEICSKSFKERPHVDHDHETGHVRGILCGRCNKALGYIEDSGWVERAQRYLAVRSTSRKAS